jgi:predicted AlkP superfamily pyrophosphatase or phosphodiesterase
MQKVLSFICIGLLLHTCTAAQNTPGTELSRPKLVVGLMVDQMRWDYFYRFYDRYSNDGFKRLLNQGFSCENTLIPYALTVTASGHASVYTGSVPAINGIVGNEWYDRSKGRYVYCVEDSTVKAIGGNEKAEPMSPRNLWSTTICDELKLATNFRSKVLGIALKDRGGILPAGHSADGAYWYDDYTGNWITSTYYMNQIPGWVQEFNNKKWVDSFYSKNWAALYPLETYLQSETDNRGYEGRFSHETASVFPHELKSRMGKDYVTIKATPYGNTLTLEFTKTALRAEKMGMDNITDFLAVSLSSPDYIGHQFGPNSIEVEDMYLRLDKDIADFFKFLDKEVGEGQYLFFITADHAVAHVPAFLQQHHIPAGSIASNFSVLNDKLKEITGIPNSILEGSNFQLYLNYEAISAKKKFDKSDMKKIVIAELMSLPHVLTAFDTDKIDEANLPKEVKEMFVKGFNSKLSGDIQIVVKPGYFYGGQSGTTHGTWYPYDSHIPLAWMGWGIKPGKSNREVYMTDIAPTIAALLRIQMPNGSIGKVIEEAIK